MTGPFVARPVSIPGDWRGWVRPGVNLKKFGLGAVARWADFCVTFGGGSLIRIGVHLRVNPRQLCQLRQGRTRRVRHVPRRRPGSRGWAFLGLSHSASRPGSRPSPGNCALLMPVSLVRTSRTYAPFGASKHRWSFPSQSPRDSARTKKGPAAMPQGPSSRQPRWTRPAIS